MPTAKNVFSNEVRLGFWHVIGAPPREGFRTTPPPGESGSTRTFRVLQAYFNKRFQTYGRKVQFYGLAGSTDPAADQAEAKKASSSISCSARTTSIWRSASPSPATPGRSFCNPQKAEVYQRLRPGFFSFMIDRTSAAGFGAEFVCKKLIGKTAKFSGTETDKERKISVVTEQSHDGGNIAPAVYEQALQNECGATYTGRSFQLESNNDRRRRERRRWRRCARAA